MEVGRGARGRCSLRSKDRALADQRQTDGRGSAPSAPLHRHRRPLPRFASAPSCGEVFRATGRSAGLAGAAERPDARCKCPVDRSASILLQRDVGRRGASPLNEQAKRALQPAHLPDTPFRAVCHVLFRLQAKPGLGLVDAASASALQPSVIRRSPFPKVRVPIRPRAGTLRRSKDSPARESPACKARCRHEQQSHGFIQGGLRPGGYRQGIPRRS